MKNKNILTLLILSSLFTFCSKKDDAKPEEITDCKSKNYAIVTVNYKNVTEEHYIIVSRHGTNSLYRMKTTNKGIATDTLHLVPNRYDILVQRVNSSGASATHPNQDKTLTQCGNTIIDTDI